MTSEEFRKLYEPRYPLKRLLRKCIVLGEDLIITGDKGMGKTYLSRKIAEEKLDESDWGYSDKYMTNTEFYKFLYHNREMIFLIVDDAGGFLSDNQRSTVMLKRALGNKELGWRSNKIPDQMSYFELEPNLIIISNEIKAIEKSRNFGAILSRSEFYDLELNRRERYIIFARLLEPEEMEILNFLKRYNLKVNIRDLNRYRKAFSREADWKDYILTDKVDNRKERLALRLSVSDLSRDERLEIWKKRTGLSESTYWRDKERAQV